MNFTYHKCFLGNMKIKILVVFQKCCWIEYCLLKWIFYLMPTISLLCPHCSSEEILKHGKTSLGKPRFYCKSCRKTFLTKYQYNACKPEVKRLIVPMTLNSSGIRDISRVLKISPNTVLSTLRNAYKQLPIIEKPRKVTSVQVDE